MRGISLDEKLRRVPLRAGVHHGQVVVHAAADAAAVIEHPALLADHHLQPGFQRRDRRHGARDPAADHQQVRLDCRPVLFHRLSLHLCQVDH
jgi:hypothetical protein